MTAMTIEMLLDIEAIKQLKARYFRYLDTKQWDEWRKVFTDDFYGLYTGNHPDIEFHSGDDIVALNREMLADVPTVHQGHTPEIAITSATTATGIWSMYDNVALPGAEFQAWGHYHDEYRKENGEWRISRVRLTRLKVETGAC